MDTNAHLKLSLSQPSLGHQGSSPHSHISELLGTYALTLAWVFKHPSQSPSLQSLHMGNPESQNRTPAAPQKETLQFGTV